MQKFIITINPDFPYTAEEIGRLFDIEATVIEIPQPPFPSGMDENLPYEINVPGEPMPKTIYPRRKYPGIPILSDYHPESAPCGASIWGTPDDIDSAMRHHMSFCSACQLIRENNGSDTP